jgi:alpha-mannosidase
VTFKLGPTGAGAANMVAAKGQRIALPPGTFNRLYVLATAAGGDASGVLQVEGRTGAAARTLLNVQDWTGAIGQWNSRLRNDQLLREVYVPQLKDQSWPFPEIEAQIVTRWQPGGAAPVQGIDLIRPGFVKRDDVAWVATHRHAPKENEIYIFGYVFRYAVDLPMGATGVVLPTNGKIRVLAMSVANEVAPGTRPATLLYAAELPAPPAVRAAPAAVPRGGSKDVPRR